MPNDRVDVGAVATNYGWLVLSVPRGLLLLATSQLASGMGEVKINGIVFKLREAKAPPP